MNLSLGIFTLSLLFITLKAEDLGVVKITPDSKERFVKINDPLAVSCFVTADSSETKNLEWTKPSENDLTVNTNRVSLTSGNIKLYANLTIKNIKAEQLGTYKCSFGASSESFTLKAATEEKSQSNYTYGDESASLSCKMVGVDGSRISKVEWLKNDTLVTELSDKKRFAEDPKNYTLTISSPTREDADLYIARFHFKDINTPYECEVPYAAAPLVLDFDKSKNLIEDDTMELQCKVKGYPHAVVQWMKDDKKLNETNKRIVLSPLHGYQNAKLVIKSVKFEDAGDYTCKAYSTFFNISDEKMLVVRVKDKLAALWPFLGIVGEVIILCTIIFIYERRRNKQAESDTNNAEDVDGSASDKKEGLRHRNTQSNNPTA